MFICIGNIVSPQLDLDLRPAPGPPPSIRKFLAIGLVIIESGLAEAQFHSHSQNKIANLRILFVSHSVWPTSNFMGSHARDCPGEFRGAELARCGEGDIYPAIRFRSSPISPPLPLSFFHPPDEHVPRPISLEMRWSEMW